MTDLSHVIVDFSEIKREQSGLGAYQPSRREEPSHPSDRHPQNEYKEEVSGSNNTKRADRGTQLPTMSSSSGFSWSDYCSGFPYSSHDEFLSSIEHESSREFLVRLNLTSIYPYCPGGDVEHGIPPMGPLIEYDHHDTGWDAVVTFFCSAVPALYAMFELWLRLFAFYLAPLGISVLLWDQFSSSSRHGGRNNSSSNNNNNHESSSFFCFGPNMVFLSILLSVASSVILVTDTFYVLQYGAKYGGMQLVLSVLLSTRAVLTARGESQTTKTTTRTGDDNKSRFRVLPCYIVSMSLLTGYLFFRGRSNFGGPAVPGLSEGLYYDTENPLIRDIVSHWDPSTRTYSVEQGATPWMPSGDSRTGLPFLLNHWEDPEFVRVFAKTADEEAVALDIAFPPKRGHDPSRAIIVVLHGLSGGSDEEYIQDLVHRRNEDGHTVIIMIARGLMDLPIRRWNVFHGARTEDAHVAAGAIRRAVKSYRTSSTQFTKIIGVGYSMGAIVLSNYVARYGPDCQLDAALAISGGLDMRKTLEFDRAMRLWQPLLVEELRGTFVIQKFGEKYHERLSKEQMLGLLRASHIAGVDEYAVVAYNGFDDIVHYYSEMSVLGDISPEDIVSNGKPAVWTGKRVANISIPFCVLHALDDPLIPWTAVASHDGLMHPENLVKTGNGQLMVLLTKAGGHVGWPMGWFPHLEKWNWMSTAVKGFTDAVVVENNLRIFKRLAT